MTLDDLQALLVPLKEGVSKTIDIPEPATQLDLASRKGNAERQFKHLHQACLLHQFHFTQANRIKIVAILEGYCAVAKEANYLGPYLFARNILELNAFLYEIKLRLSTVYQKPLQQWISKGEEFFGVIVRARFGTSDSAKRGLLKQESISNKHLYPIKITECLMHLDQEHQELKIMNQYDSLCDSVHHNLSSHMLSSAGYYIADAATSEGAGTIHMPKSGPITRYEYPVLSKSAKAEKDTLMLVHETTQRCVFLINTMPSSPFPDEQIWEMTGTQHGMTRLK